MLLLLAALALTLAAPALAWEMGVEAAPAEEEVPMVESVLLAGEDEEAGPAGAPAGDGEAAPAGALAEDGEAAPIEGPEAPALDETTQQSGGPEAAGDGEEPLPGEGEEVPSVVMTLEAPSLPLSGVKIGIDPGHQLHGNSEKETVAPNSRETKAKVSSGTSGVATHIPEYVTVLEISLKLRDALEAKGAEVYMTRETHDVNISNQERAKMMNGYGVDLMLRIHCDGVNNRSKHGIALYCSRSNSIAAESYRAAEAILPAVCAVTGAKSNGIVSNDNYTGQNWATVPCIMVECGFMSNPEEDVLLNDEDYQWKLAAGMTNGIIDYIEQRDARER